MKVGLFFGSFNPIHNGHLAIANYMAEYTDIDQIWFIVSPHSPFKEKKNLLAEYHRYELVLRAIGDDPAFRASNIEFNLPRPSYTIDTLTYLSEKNPGKELCLIMGADGLSSFNKWKNYEQIIKYYHRYVYPRLGSDKDRLPNMENATLVDAPIIGISSSFIRKAIREGKDVRYFMPLPVWKYIQEMNFYKKV
jgi:nicotinate-nucleotide adenylyltransferase